MTTVSVIIPVRDDADGLAECLAALQRQTYPRDQLQIVVVDDGSTQSLDSLKAQYPAVTWLRQDPSGPAAARNKGVAAASGDVLAFTDADCRPAESWLERGVPDVHPATVVVGWVAVTAQDETRPRVIELYDQLFSLRQDHNLADGFGATANLLVTRETFAQVGPFDADTFAAAAGEDVDWCWRAKQAGAELTLQREAVVQHPAARSLYSKVQQIKCYGRATAALRRKWSDPPQSRVGVSAAAHQCIWSGALNLVTKLQLTLLWWVFSVVRRGQRLLP